jgi:hypothetical protein
MSFIKKNLIFTIIMTACILAFAAGAYFAFAESGKIDQKKQKVTSAESQLKSMRFADPAPTPENVEASAENVAELKAGLRKIREDLGRGARITTSADGIGVMAGIQQFISNYQRKAATQTDKDGEPFEIIVPDDFAFGFEQYLDEATMLDDDELIPVLDKQRQILSYLLNRLYEAEPESIVSVEREVLEQKAEGSSSAKGFAIHPAITAKVPGAINTLAFRLAFTGYTDSLRRLLNDLAKFDLPIVVRSIEVDRPSGMSTTAKVPANNDLDAFFGVFDGGSNPELESPEEAQKPVISENISTFTVVLEFIEIALPAQSAVKKANSE